MPSNPRTAWPTPFNENGLMAGEMNMKKRLLTKYENNPVMCPAMMPETVLYTFNPGAIEHNGETIMVMDVTTLDDIHRLWIARSKDGVNFTADPTPAPWPAPDPIHPETCTYDPRIT